MRFWKGSCSWLVLLCVGCGAAWAEAVPEPQNNCKMEKGKHLLWENDVLTGKLFGRSDKWYTNGFKFYGSDKPDCVPAYWFGLHDQIEALHDVRPDGKPMYTIQTGHVIGQLMFTPKNLTIATPQPMDRFWGGWLYGGIVVQRQPHDSQQPGGKNRNELETLELDMGVTGPISGAEQVQRVVHALSNSTMPSGWGNQIKTELGVQFNYSRIRRVWEYSVNSEAQNASSWDFSWHYGGAAGTLFDYVNGGATLRFGCRLTDAAPNVIESPSIGQFRRITDGGYLLARLDMKGVVHNSFIDGSLFRGQPHASDLSSKRIVPQFTYGIVNEWKYGGGKEGLRLSALIHRRGSEFRSPAGPGAIFSFATLNIEWDLGG